MDRVSCNSYYKKDDNAVRLDAAAAAADAVVAAGAAAAVVVVGTDVKNIAAIMWCNTVDENYNNG